MKNNSFPTPLALIVVLGLLLSAHFICAADSGPTVVTTKFNSTGIVGVDGAGNIYIADSSRISRYGKNHPSESDQTTLANLATGVSGMAVTPEGLIYCTSQNDTISRITPLGSVTVITGMAGSSGYLDGSLANARFYDPAGIALDSAGNIFVADRGNHVIRKISADGQVTTVAGRAGVAASVDGQGDTARFNSPTRLAMDATGNLYVCEYNRYSIRRITPSGVVTTFAGNSAVRGSVDGVGSAARFDSIGGLAVSKTGDLYVIDGPILRRVSPDSTVSWVAGAFGQYSQIDGVGEVARFSYPRSIAASPDGSIIIGDQYATRKAVPAGLPLAPFIATQPKNAVGVPGGTATFSVEIIATPDASFSWRKYGEELIVPDQPVLSLSNLTSSDAGDYSVVITNSSGTVTSAVAKLAIVAKATNDHFANRAPLSGAPASASAYYVSATRESGEPQHNEKTEGASLWWTWTAPSTGFVTVDAKPSTAPSVVRVYTGTSISALIPVSVAPAYTGSNSPARTTFQALAGTTYQIAIEPETMAPADMARLSLHYSYTIQRFAGDPAGGSSDGTSTAARFSSPYGIVRDSNGNFFVSDYYNQTIRKITPAGTVSTFAGTAGQNGSANGTGAAARFYGPRGLAIDSANNIYVADSNNYTVRKITPAGVVTTLAGTAGETGILNATGAAARFQTVESIAVDGSGTVYVADAGNGEIRRISSTGVVTTFAGSPFESGTTDGIGTAARFQSPSNVVHAANKLYVTEGSSPYIRIIDIPTTQVTTRNYSPLRGEALAADAAGYVYLEDYRSLTRVSPLGVASEMAGNPVESSNAPAEGDALQASFATPSGAVFDPSGNLWFTAGNSIWRATISTQPLAPFITVPLKSQTVAQGVAVAFRVIAFSSPLAPTYQWRKDGSLLNGETASTLSIPAAGLGASGSYEVTVTTSAGTVTSSANLTVLAPAVNDSFANAALLSGTTASGTGHNYGASRDPNEPLLETTSAGRTLWWKWTAPNDGTIIVDTTGSETPTRLAVFKGDTLQTLQPVGAAGTVMDPKAWLEVKVQAGTTYRIVVDSFGTAEGNLGLQLHYAYHVTTFAGTIGSSGAVDGTGTNARFFSPQAIARDSAGSLYIADGANRIIRKITPAGVVTTLAGSLGVTGSADGTGPAAQFDSPAGIAIDSAGNLYVTDSAKHTIRKITPAGVVTTIAGTAGVAGVTDGSGAAARFSGPKGIAFHSDGALYVADSANHTIRRVTLAGSVTTFAGLAGSEGSIDAIGSQARFSQPTALTAAPDGLLYLLSSESSGETIRRISVPGAQVTTRMSSAAMRSAFSDPRSISFDSIGNLYVVGYPSDGIKKITPSNSIVSLAGTSGASRDGTGTNAQFQYLTGVAVAPDGTAYLTESSSHVIRRAAPSNLPYPPLITAVPADVSLPVGAPISLTVETTASPTSSVIWRRNGIAIPGSTSATLSISSATTGDSGEYTAEFSNASGTAISTAIKVDVLPPALNDHFANRSPLTGVPVSVKTNNFGASTEAGEPVHFEASGRASIWWTWTAPSSGAVVIDTLGSKIEAMLAVYTGNVLNTLTPIASGLTSVEIPVVSGTSYQIAVDGRNGTAGPVELNIRWAYAATTFASGVSPRRVVVDAQGNGWFTASNQTVGKISPAGVIAVVAGTANSSGSTDGVGATARFSFPNGIVRATDGTLYVADTANHTIRRIASDGTVSTLAGTAGSPGTTNGIGATARFRNPYDLALDSSGANLYVCDSGNYAIRRIVLSTREVSNFAGTPGYQTFPVRDGVGTEATFYYPQSIVRGEDGSFYVTDSGKFRNITTGGNVTTLVSGVDGSLTAEPGGTFLGTRGHAIQRVTIAGQISPLCGNENTAGLINDVGSRARFSSPSGLARRSDGTILVADGNSCFRLIARADQAQAPLIQSGPEAVSTFAGADVTLSVAATGTPNLTYQWLFNGNAINGATGSKLLLPNAAVGQSGNYSVQVTNTAGTTTSSPAAVVVKPRPPNDAFAQAVTLTGNAPAIVANNTGATTESGELAIGGKTGGASLWWKWTAPVSGAVIADSAGSSFLPYIGVYTGTGLNNLTEVVSTVPTSISQTSKPRLMFTATEGTTYWIAVDGDFGQSGDLVLHLVYTYSFSTLAGMPGMYGAADGTGSAARFYYLNGAAADAAGNIYIADYGNNTIRKLTAAGVVTTLAGTAGSYGYVNGTGAAARFNNPIAITLGIDGLLYIADHGNHAIRRLNPTTGAVTTFAGPTTATPGTADGTGTAARFNYPTAITADSAGNFYVADRTNHSVRKITATGVVTTLAGLNGTSGNVDGAGTAARFKSPIGISMDSMGNILVADSGNSTIRKVTSAGAVTTVVGGLPSVSGVLPLSDGSILIGRNQLLEMLTPDNYVLTIAGGGSAPEGGTGYEIAFSAVSMVTADPTGRILLLDQYAHVLRRGVRTSAPAAPVITKQPQGVRIVAGNTVTLTSGALGNPLPTFQWTKNGQNLPGKTSSTLTLTDVQPSDSGNYVLLATNSLGAATSQTAVLDILPLPFNDSFAGRARIIAESLSISAYNFGASSQTGEPGHGGSPARHSVWFTWAAPATGDVTVDTIGSTLATRLAVYRGDTLASLNLVGEDSSGGEKKFGRVRFAANAGDVFQFAVDGVGNATGDFRLRVDYSWNFALYSGAWDQPGSTNGTAAQARYNYPSAWARDASGNDYIVDTMNHVIRKISAAGVVSTFAGSPGLTGSTNGTGTAARFNRPYGIAVDASGNVFVADTLNHTIRKITPAGAVTTFAGAAGTSGSADGTGTAARFDTPVGIARDSSGNFFITDYGNGLVRKVTAAGVVTTFSGELNTQGNLPNLFSSPYGVAIDGSGNVYVSDRADIRKITPQGVASYFVGSSSGYSGSVDGSGESARFNLPYQMAFGPGGDLFVAEAGNHLIRKVSPSGEVRTIGGSAGTLAFRDGTAEVALFAEPTGILVDAGGYVWVADSANNGLRVGARQIATSAPRIVTEPTDLTVAPGGTASFLVVASGYPAPAYQWRKNGQIIPATGPILTIENVLTAADYDVMVANANGTVTSRVASLTLASNPPNNNFAAASGLSGTTASATGIPASATAEAGEPAHGGRPAARSLWWTWTAPSRGDYIVETVGSANPTRVAIYTGSSVGSLQLIAQDDGSLAHGASRVQFIAESGTTYRIAVDVDEAPSYGPVRLSVDFALRVNTFAGAAGFSGTVNGAGSAARFSGPAGVARDGAGNYFVTDYVDHVVRKITPSGAVTVFAGTAGASGSTNGAGSVARFSTPLGIAIDASNNLYVADYGNRVIRKITPAGSVSTFAGTVGAGGSTDGTGSAARFESPSGVAVASTGLLYVTDFGAHTVRKVDLSTAAVTTLAGSAMNSGNANGIGTAARFNGPRGPAVDASGNVFIADFFNHTIRRITPTGEVTTVAGFAGSSGSADGLGSAARLTYPSGIAIDSTGRLFVAEQSDRLRRVTLEGLVTTVAGGADGSQDGVSFAARFALPTDICLSTNGKFIITDFENYTIRTAAPASRPKVTLVGTTPVTFEAAAAYTDAGATANDSTDGVLTPAMTTNTVVANIPGLYSVTWTATASSGLTDSATRTVNVVDTTAPTISGTFVPLSMAPGTPLPDYRTQANATDIVGVTSIGQSPAPGTITTAGTLAVTITAKDAANNTKSVSFNITVNTQPSVTLVGANPLTFEAAATYTDPGAVGNDAEDGVRTPTMTGNTVVANKPGTYAVAWTVSDSMGATRSVTRTVNVVDTTAPDTSISSIQPTPTSSTSAAITFSGNDVVTPGGSLIFEGSLDGDAFTLITSPKSLTGLSEGSHTYRVRARDEAGNVDQTPASVTWVVDKTAPETTITSTQATPTNATTAAIVFTGSDDATAAGSLTFEGSLDGAGFAPVTNPVHLSNLSEGSHTYQVRATDAAGNVDLTPANVTWVVDTTAPTVDGTFTPLRFAAGKPLPDYTGQAVTSDGTGVGLASVVQSPSPGSATVVGAIAVTLTVKDAANNETRKAFTVVAENTSPTLTLLGANPLKIRAGATYTDPGATATDPEDGTLTAQITSNTVAPNVPGTYQVTWSATDSQSTSVTITRSVVVRPEGPILGEVAVKGSPVPHAGVDARIQTGATWTSFGEPVISDTGDVAYLAKWKAPALAGSTSLPAQNGTGLFINDTLLVRVGESVPGAGTQGIPLNATCKSFKDPVMDQGGHVAFLATIAGSGVSTVKDGVVLSNGRSGTLEVIAREGDIAPETGGAVFKSFANVSIQGEDVGGTLFVATLAAAPGSAPVNAKNNSGVWWLAAGEDSVRKVARKGDPGFAPEETIQSIQILQAISGSTGHGRGQLSGASALLQLGFVSGAKSRQAQVLAEPGTLTEIAGAGDTLGGVLLPNAIWDKVTLPTANRQGASIAVLGTLQVGSAGITKANAKGVFHSADAGATWEPLAQIGGDAAALAQGALFSALNAPAHSASGPGVAFFASVKGGSGVTGASNDAIWWKRDTDASLTPLVREGGLPPQPSEGARWKSFSSLVYPGNGGPLFVATLKPGLPPGPERITAKNDLGLYAVDAFDQVQELLRENQPALGKTVKTFSVFKAIAGSAGSARSYNAVSQVAALVTFTDGKTGIVKIEIP